MYRGHPETVTLGGTPAIKSKRIGFSLETTDICATNRGTNARDCRVASLTGKGTFVRCNQPITYDLVGGITSGGAVTLSVTIDECAEGVTTASVQLVISSSGITFANTTTIPYNESVPFTFYAYHPTNANIRMSLTNFQLVPTGTGSEYSVQGSFDLEQFRRGRWSVPFTGPFAADTFTKPEAKCVDDGSVRVLDCFEAPGCVLSDSGQLQR